MVSRYRLQTFNSFFFFFFPIFFLFFLHGSLVCVPMCTRMHAFGLTASTPMPVYTCYRLTTHSCYRSPQHPTSTQSTSSICILVFSHLCCFHSLSLSSSVHACAVHLCVLFNQTSNAGPSHGVTIFSLLL